LVAPGVDSTGAAVSVIELFDPTWPVSCMANRLRREVRPAGMHAALAERRMWQYCIELAVNNKLPTVAYAHHCM